MASTPVTEDTVKEIARRWMEVDKISPYSTPEHQLDRPCRIKHVAWKFNDNFNEIWIDGVLGVVFTAETPAETEEAKTKVQYNVDIEKPETKSAVYAVELATLARWHIAWLMDPNVWIDSATIDMEYDSNLVVDKRKFQIKELNISVQSNYTSINGWLLHMHPNMESFVFRGHGILDGNKFLQLPFAPHLRKLMILYESSFDDRLLVQIPAQHLQLASDFISEVGVNKFIHKWNDQNYPMRSSFVLYVQINTMENVVKNLTVLETVLHESGVNEYLLEMKNPATRMRVSVRSSSVICTVFAVDNSQAPPPLKAD